jgi:hypothetical protein
MHGTFHHPRASALKVFGDYVGSEGYKPPAKEGGAAHGYVAFIKYTNQTTAWKQYMLKHNVYTSIYNYATSTASKRKHDGTVGSTTVTYKPNGVQWEFSVFENGTMHTLRTDLP